MSTSHSKKKPVHRTSKKVLPLVGYIFLIPPVYLTLVWFNTSSTLSPSGRINAFLDHFPTSIHHFHTLVAFSLVCCIISLVLVSRSFNQPAVFLRVLDIIAAMIAALIGLMNIFQLI